MDNTVKDESTKKTSSRSVYFIEYANIENKNKRYSIWSKVYIQEKSAKARAVKLLKYGRDVRLYKVDEQYWGEPIPIDSESLAQNDTDDARAIEKWCEQGPAHRIIAGIYAESGRKDKLARRIENKTFIGIFHSIDSVTARIQSRLSH